MWQKQLILHGAVILLIGFACGAPMGSSIVRRKPEDTVRAWRVAHSSLVMGGVLLLALAGAVEHLRLGNWALFLLTVAFIGSSYAFAIVLPLGAHYGVRGLTSQAPLLVSDNAQRKERAMDTKEFEKQLKQGGYLDVEMKKAAPSFLLVGRRHRAAS